MDNPPSYLLSSSAVLETDLDLGKNCLHRSKWGNISSAMPSSQRRKSSRAFCYWIYWITGLIGGAISVLITTPMIPLHEAIRFFPHANGLQHLGIESARTKHFSRKTCMFSQKSEEDIPKNRVAKRNKSAEQVSGEKNVRQRSQSQSNARQRTTPRTKQQRNERNEQRRRIKRTPIPRSKEGQEGSKAENSFDRVIRVLSQPAEVKTFSGKASNEIAKPNTPNGTRQYHVSKSNRSGFSSKRRRYGLQRRSSLMRNVTAGSISKTTAGSTQDSPQMYENSTKTSVENLPHVQRKGPPVNIDPPYRKVDIFYDGDGDLFTAITTSSRYYGSHMWIDQADKLTRRFKALWVQQWYRHAEKWQVAPNFMTEAIQIDATGGADKRLQESNTVYGLDVYEQKKQSSNGKLSNLLSNAQLKLKAPASELKDNQGSVFAAVPPWPDAAEDPRQSPISGKKSEGGINDASSKLIQDPVQLRPLGPLLLDVASQRLKAHHPRVIAIGDVHGCVDELQALLRRVGYSPGDQLVFLGDMVAKGPDSQAVVQLARELGGIAVRGNHEFEVLRWHRVLQKGGDPPLLASEHYRLARSMPPQELEWLHLTPWFFSSEHLNTLFVHAGFVHEKSLTRQNPRLMMNMRSILPDGTVTSKHFSSWPWARCWKGPQTVLFGHDAERGLQIHEHAIGIDTGCVYGGRLTACILPEKKIVSVNAKREYAPFRKRARSLTQGKENDDKLIQYQEQSALENDPENITDD